jgi:hypothetical protein
MFIFFMVVIGVVDASVCQQTRNALITCHPAFADNPDAVFKGETCVDVCRFFDPLWNRYNNCNVLHVDAKCSNGAKCLGFDPFDGSPIEGADERGCGPPLCDLVPPPSSLALALDGNNDNHLEENDLALLEICWQRSEGICAELAALDPRGFVGVYLLAVLAAMWGGGPIFPPCIVEGLVSCDSIGTLYETTIELTDEDYFESTGMRLDPRSITFEVTSRGCGGDIIQCSINNEEVTQKCCPKVHYDIVPPYDDICVEYFEWQTVQEGDDQLCPHMVLHSGSFSARGDTFEEYQDDYNAKHSVLTRPRSQSGDAGIHCDSITKFEITFDNIGYVTPPYRRDVSWECLEKDYTLLCENYPLP